jgi:hypothetical protein
MGIFTKARNRLTRTIWDNVNQAMQEVFAVFGSDAPIDIDSKVEHRGDVTFQGGAGAGGVSITRNEDGGTEINFGDGSDTTFAGQTTIGGPFTFAPQKTQVVNDKDEPVSFDDYIKQPQQAAAPTQTSGGDSVLFGTVAEDSAPGSTSVSVSLEGAGSIKTPVQLFTMHPEGMLRQGDPLTVFVVRAANGSITYRAQPPTWLG